MEKTGTNKEKLLDPAATRAFQEFAALMREALLKEASSLSPTEHISEDDLNAAYKALNFPTKDSLRIADAQAIISQALRENRVIEWVSYGMAIVLFLFGLALLAVGTVANNSLAQVGFLAAGSIVELLILMPLRFAINSRRHNIALRMLGIVLNRVDDPKILARLLKDTFLSVVLGKVQFKVNG